MVDKVIAMVPARFGSERLKLKNLRMLDGRPVISYALNAALESGVFDRVVLNSDHSAFADVALRYGSEFYKRPAELGSSDTHTDSFLADFMQAYPSDVIALINPTTPLQTSAEIKNVVRYFLDKRLDSLWTVKEERFHALIGDIPINFNLNEKFAKTQDLKAVQIGVYSVMMCRTKVFIEQYRKTGSGVCAGQFGVYPVQKEASMVIKYEDDLRVAEAVLRARRSSSTIGPLFDPIADQILHG